MSTIRTKTASRKPKPRAGEPPAPGPISFYGISLTDLAIGLVLILAIFSMYAQVGTFDFINYDDPGHVFDNPHVKAGLTLESIRWAMTAVVVANWIPVTLLSHMLDCQLFHLQSGMHHLDSVFIHMLSTLLLFAALKRATGSRWASAFVALIFGVHPLHVESVAWISERKDVLSAMFWFLATYAYIRYTEHPSVRGYCLVALAFCLGLMSKPMLVTFPFTLLLLDFWPLRRFEPSKAQAFNGTDPVPWKKLLLEKIPLLALAAAASCVTFMVQHSSGATMPYPLPMRFANALVSYFVYIGQMLWPARLAVLYLYRHAPPAWQTAASAILLVVISGTVVKLRKTRPYLAVGWFWFLGTLVPVIGLVQVGVQAHADRYMYIPMVGLLIMIAWGTSDLVAHAQENRPQVRLWVALAATAAGLACIVVGWIQTGYWQNSLTLFEHATEVTEGNFIAELNVGNYLMNNRRGAEAIPHFEAALRADPEYGEAESNIGMVLGNMPGRMPEAITHFEAAVRLRPNLPEAHFNLATALSAMPGREAEAIAEYQITQRLQFHPEIPALIAQLRARQK